MAEELPQNFRATAGEGVVIKITVFEDGIPVAITDAQAVVWKMARTARSTALITKTLGAGVVIIPDQAAAGQPNAGRVDVTLDPAETAPLDGEYYCECFMTAADGAVSRIYFGRPFFGPKVG